MRIGGVFEGGEVYKEIVNKGTKSEKIIRIDGRKLSKAERDFEEFCQCRFDEAKWLKDNGLIY